MCASNRDRLQGSLLDPVRQGFLIWHMAAATAFHWIYRFSSQLVPWVISNITLPMQDQHFPSKVKRNSLGGKRLWRIFFLNQSRSSI